MGYLDPCPMSTCTSYRPDNTDLCRGMPVRILSHNHEGIPTMPTIADQIAGLPSGARFHRADLHIHSFNGSHDVSDPAMTAESIVQTSVSEKLALIAITDHNEIVNVESAIKATYGTAVTVIPGVELSTPEGHLLVYFATVDDLASFYGKLTFAGKGTANYRCQSSLLDCLNKIDPTRGYAILAHVDAEGGLEKESQRQYAAQTRHHHSSIIAGY